MNSIINQKNSPTQFEGYRLSGGQKKGCCYQYNLVKISTGERFFFEIPDRKIQSFGPYQFFSQEEYAKELCDFHFKNLDVIRKLGINYSMKTIKILGITEMEGVPVFKYKECSYHTYGAKDEKEIYLCQLSSESPFYRPQC